MALARSAAGKHRIVFGPTPAADVLLVIERVGEQELWAPTEAGGTRYFQDVDRDGRGNAMLSVLACERPADHVASPDDCNDRDPATYVGAPEICDGKDNDCDGAVDKSGGKSACQSASASWSSSSSTSVSSSGSSRTSVSVSITSSTRRPSPTDASAPR
jgi:hypothetical protein